jgi:pimeloyl-ACP methyl ester carboxylesterase
MMNTQPFGAATDFIDLGHSRVPYYRVGAGPDVLFIHGWPLHSATFRKIVPGLADRFTCHLVDLPGTGGSEWDQTSQISLRDHSASIQTCIERIGLREYAIVSHDSGAVIAQLIAVEDAGVRGLVMGNTEIPGFRAWQVQTYQLLEQMPFGPVLFGTAMKLRALRNSPLAYGGCFSDTALIEGEFAELFIEPMLSSQRVVDGQCRLLHTFDWNLVDELADVQARLRMPVKFIWGARDGYFPLAKLKPTLARFGGTVSLALLEQGKLFAHEEFPEDFVRESRAFLEDCFSSRASEAS